MRRPLLVVAFPALALVALGLPFSSCTTDSEAPNASYGPPVDPGTLNNPCRSDNSCENDTTLVCIVEDDGDDATCRQRCEVAADPTDCAADFLCVRLANSTTEGACIPIGGLGEPCGVCDTDLACVGGACLQQCEIVDGGSNCAATESCESPDGGPDVCVGD